MAVDAIGGAIGAGAGDAVQRSGVSEDDFIRLFLTQLSFQDPLEPVDNAEFLAQLAQFTSVSQLQSVNANLEALLGVQASNQAVGLLGRTVEVSSSPSNVIGKVTTLDYRTGSPLLTVVGSDGAVLESVSLSRVALVRE